MAESKQTTRSTKADDKTATDDKETKEEKAAREEDEARAEAYLDNPKVQIQPGMGEILGGDLVKMNEDGELETVEGVPDPPYDLNAEDPVEARKPDHADAKTWG